VTVALTLTDAPDAGDLAAIQAGLAGFNEADVGPADRRPLAIILRDGDTVVGGLSGFTAWGWLYVQWLWLDDTHRGQGLAGDMLTAAEAEARTRGCHGAWIDTFSPVALKVYRRLGYQPFGELPDFPIGRTRTFLRKAL
jgi:GNAT superfamily N-acetyltransferase